MKRTVYLSEQEFADVCKGKKNIKNYPNLYIKEIGNVTYHIIPSDEVCTSHVLTTEEKEWFVPFVVNDDVVELRLEKSCCFPTELIAGVDRASGMFTMGNTLSEKTGWIKANGTLGSRNALFLKSKVNAAIEILNEFGYSFTI